MQGKVTKEPARVIKFKNELKGQEKVILSDNDQLMTTIPLSAIFYFAPPVGAQLSFESLCDSMEQFISNDYQILSGQLLERENNGGYDLIINNFGVQMIKATAAVDFSELNFFDPIGTIPAEVYSPITYGDPTKFSSFSCLLLH